MRIFTRFGALEIPRQGSVAGLQADEPQQSVAELATAADAAETVIMPIGGQDGEWLTVIARAQSMCQNLAISVGLASR